MTTTRPWHTLTSLMIAILAALPLAAAGASPATFDFCLEGVTVAPSLDAIAVSGDIVQAPDGSWSGWLDVFDANGVGHGYAVIATVTPTTLGLAINAWTPDNALNVEMTALAGQQLYRASGHADPVGEFVAAGPS